MFGLQWSFFVFAAAMPPAAVPVVGELRCSISHYRLWCEIDVVIGLWSRNEVVLLNLDAIDKLLRFGHRSGL